MTNEELQRLVESNARSIQAFGDHVETFRLTTEQNLETSRQERQELRESMLRLNEVAEGIANLLARQEEAQPTILAKLNSIEGKVDRLLQRPDNQSNR